jgi:allophanate hydrolase
VTRAITEPGASISAPDTFAALYRLRELQRQTCPVWEGIDCLVVPTASTHYKIDAVLADPVRLNSNLGYYTNFVNLLDLAAVAVPTGLQHGATVPLPWGVTLIAPAGKDLPLLALAARLHAQAVDTVGATLHGPHRLANAAPDTTPFVSGQVHIAVCGAHLSGLPLNWQLTQRGARLVRSTRSAPAYKLYALPGGPPYRPGMVRVMHDGKAIDLEVWALSAQAFGEFVAAIPAPLGIGKVLLEDGSQVSGFVCEALAAEGAQDITHLGGWRAYLAQLATA